MTFGGSAFGASAFGGSASGMEFATPLPASFQDAPDREKSLAHEAYVAAMLALGMGAGGYVDGAKGALVGTVGAGGYVYWRLRRP